MFRKEDGMSLTIAYLYVQKLPKLSKIFGGFESPVFKHSFIDNLFLVELASYPQ